MNPTVCRTRLAVKTFRLFSLLFLGGLLFFPAAAAAKEDALRRSLVKVFTSIQNPNYYEPWTTGSQEDVSGSGCILSGHRILTNAHVVANQIFIQVLKDGDTKKYTAKKLYVAHDCDLAVLTVEDPGFFKGTKPVTFGGLPSLRDRVEVYGYPVGGEVLSITEGGISRIELTTYSHSMKQLLCIQTNAAINPGNSGGPVFSRKKMVGVAFQGYNGAVAQNTGYIIPVQIIQRFLKLVKKGSYSPVPSLGLYTEPMENDSLRAFYGMKRPQTGLLVSKVVYGSSAWGKIKENDVLLSIDGFPIASEGTVPLRKGERVFFSYPLCLHKIGDKMPLQLLRGRKVLKVTLTLKGDTRLVPLVEYDKDPSYLIFGGLVFAPLNINYYQAAKPPPACFYSLFYDGLPSENQKQVVLMSHILSHEVNKGYGSRYANLVVDKVNGVSITEMKDLVKAFQKPRDGRDVIEFEDPGDLGTQIVLDDPKAVQATKDVLAQNHIQSDRSEDLK